MTRTILVTGGTRGIGLAVARRLARDGHRVAISFRSGAEAAERARDTLEAEGAEAAHFRADLSDPVAARALPDAVADRFGGLDALIDNAGVTDDGAFLTLDRARYAAVLRTNLAGTMRVTAAALPHLLRADRAAVVIMSSLGGVVGKEGQAAYATSKGALIGYTQWLGREFAAAGLAVNAIAPAFVETDMMAVLADSMTAPIIDGSALSRAGRPEEVAEAVAWLLAPGYMQSTTLRLDGGFNR
ncbi:MAG: SDR family NAD(P)-dependent oxidoreductase [Azospirillaceae bacterium]